MVLRGIDLYISPNDRIAIVGANGSGKSTLVRHLNGLLRDPNKPIYYQGKPLIGEHLHKSRLEIGILFQDPDDHLFCNTLFEDIAFGPMNQGLTKDEVAKRVERSLKDVGLLDEKEKAPHHLSYGQKKRAALAAILAMDPKTLILDEPTANLDPKQVKIIIEILQRFTGTLICISHDLFFLEKICTRAIVLQNGTIHHDYRMANLMAAPEALREHGLDFTFKLPNLSEQVDEATKSDKRRRGIGQSVNGNKIIALQDFSFTYEDGTRGLSNLNLVLHSGEQVALIGENGAGKSTLAACLTGIIFGSGSYLFNGKKINSKNRKDLWQDIGIIFQDSADQLFCPTCWEEVAFGLKQQNLSKGEIGKRVAEALCTVNLSGYEERSPLELSGGERKRLAIASVICMRPKLLIMDEPTAGLDLQGEEMFMVAIQKLSMSQILISHNLFLITNHCKRAIVMEDGTITGDYSMEDFAALNKNISTRTRL